MEVELLLIDYDTNRTTFVVPKWLSVKEKNNLVHFQKSHSRHVKLRVCFYSIYTLWGVSV